MLRISKMADYATLIMVFLAKHPEIMTAKQIATQVSLSEATVSKLLKLLSQAGLLRSQMGAKGGYQLAVLPENISVATIINAVEGNAGLTECSVHTGECAIEKVCSMRSHWQLIHETIHSALHAISLVRLCQR